MMLTDNNRRILIVDDTEAVHEDIKKVLNLGPKSEALDAIAARMLGEPSLAVEPPSATVTYSIDSAYQGEEGLNAVRLAQQEGRPYEMAFVDMRMPPGWDGVETIKKIWEVDELIQIVICTAYSDYSLQEIVDELGHSDRLLIIKKPFDGVEICQAAFALTQKRRVTKQVQDRMEDLVRANERLADEMKVRVELEGQLRHDALHDSLTKLPNRVVVRDRIGRCIKRAKRHRDYLYAVLFLDIDDFKVINDTIGHNAGDATLIEMSNRLVDSLRDLDTASRPHDETTARLGGDEFVILLDGVRDEAAAQLVADRIRKSMTEPLDLNGRIFAPTVSIGIAVGDHNYDDADEILRDADAALYEAKERGKNCSALFAVRMREKVMARLHVRNDMAIALANQDFGLHYQPIISLRDGGIVGLEALARWHHAEFGLISPANFIPVAEQTGQIVALGSWVLDEACRQLAIWKNSFSEYADLSMSVNVSSKQFLQDNVLQLVKDVLARHCLGPESLRLELTESLVLQRTALVDESLAALKELGVELHMDDFGTGYSSLSNLHELPFDALKLDRSFVANLDRDVGHASTAQAIITLAHNQGRVVVAEGIETREQLICLQEMDCDFGQGYYFSRAIEPGLIDKILASGGHWQAATRPLFVASPVFA